jgi:hypothetical protein
MEKASPDEYRNAVAELVERRSQVVASARCHAKVVVLDFADDMHLAWEGSSNLRSCRAVENLTVVNDLDLCRFHSEWIERKVKEHATQ